MVDNEKRPVEGGQEGLNKPPKTRKSPGKPQPKEPLPNLVIASSPHTVTSQSIEKIMYIVALSLIPACVAAVYFFSLSALIILITSVLSCLFFEIVFLRLFKPQANWKRTVMDGSALVTGILLALNLSAASPVWLVIVGAFVAMLLGKHVYGGLGQNPFNPALVARVFLVISFPQYMTKWIPARGDLIDAASYATPLGVLQIEGANKAMALSKWGLFLGKCGGCIGETSVLAIIIGGVILLVTGIIRWQIPLSYLLTVFLFTGIMWLINPAQNADPIFHLVTGGLVLGAFFMATDMVTTPVTARGMMLFGFGCGLLTVVIRLFGSYPEGVSFSILIMNGFTPLIDRYIRGPRYGVKAALILRKS